ncbi:MAG: RNA-binding protein, partial [Actinomycetota bacterium]|nr:RNA-binding protein [Actinomycetota bacterium]
MTTGEGTSAEPAAGNGALERPLPERVRTRVVALAADALAALADDEIPAGLRAFKRFTPARLAR